MIDLQSIFKNKIPDAEKLLQYGFCPENGRYTKAFPILDGRFIATIRICPDGGADFSVYDTEDHEEYLPARNYNAAGPFVGNVHKACEDILKDVADKCCTPEYFKGTQSKRMLQFLKDAYNAQPEFLWRSFPECAALRVPGKKPWFAVIVRLPKNKFIPQEDGVVEVLNLKDVPSNVKAYTADGTAFPAYHMNKQHWYSLFLDDRIPDEEIIRRINISYQLVNA